MQGKAHYESAENLLHRALDDTSELTHSERMRYIAAAGVHQGLAQAAATSVIMSIMRRAEIAIDGIWDELGDDERWEGTSHAAGTAPAAAHAEPLVPCSRHIPGSPRMCILAIGHAGDCDSRSPEDPADDVFTPLARPYIPAVTVTGPATADLGDYGVKPVADVLDGEQLPSGLIA